MRVRLSEPPQPLGRIAGWKIAWKLLWGQEVSTGGSWLGPLTAPTGDLWLQRQSLIQSMLRGAAPH